MFEITIYFFGSSLCFWYKSLIFIYGFLFWVQNNAGVSELYSPVTSKPRRYPGSLKMVGQASRTGERNGTVVMENAVKETREALTAVEVEQKSGVAGGVHDVHGVDSATEDQFVTPWSVSVARSVQLSYAVIFYFFIIIILVWFFNKLLLVLLYFSYMAKINITMIIFMLFLPFLKASIFNR